MKKRVLIADDNRDICDSIAMNIEDRYDVVIVHDGDSAVRHALAGDVDIILLDLMMPVRDGASVLAVLKKEGCRVPVILSSASHDLAKTARRLDAFDYLPKPFDIDELDQKLERAAAVRSESE